jgi:membrane associated rhomboid family serine protease
MTDFPGNESPIGGTTPAVRWLIAANVGVYFLQLTLLGTNNVAGWLGLSSAAFPERWWGVVTYMFVHAGLMHVGINMLMLWMFGPRVERSFGTRSFSYFYFWCGLGGAVFHLLFVQDGMVIGASGAVVGVILAYALRWPDDELYIFGLIPMRARWLAVWMIAWNVGMALADVTHVANNGGTAWMTHVGGLVFAWLYLHVPTGASLERIRRHVATIPDETEIRPIPRSQRTRRQDVGAPADEAVLKSNASVKERVTNVGTTTRRRVEELNLLLDKISRAGLESLTPAERKSLEELSRRLQG